MAIKDWFNKLLSKERKSVLSPGPSDDVPLHDYALEASTYSAVNIYNAGAAEWLFDVSGTGVDLKFSNKESPELAYRKCAPLAAIINRKALCYGNGKIWVMNSKGKESTSPEAKKLRKLFSKPNPLQSWRQFEAQMRVYQQLYGYAVILPIFPVGFSDPIDATSLWNIPPSMLEIEETNNIFYQNDLSGIIKKVTLVYKDKRTDLDVNKLLILKDTTPHFSSLVLPESRIYSLTGPISNIIGAYKSRKKLIDQRGPLWAVSSNKSDETGPQSLTDREKKIIQRDFMQNYGLGAGQSSLIITGANIKFDPIGYPTKDLMLFEEIEDDIQRICDAYVYPYALIANNKNTTFANMDSSMRMLYQDAIIPEAESDYEQLTNWFDLGGSIYIEKDFSHIACLQADKKAEAEARLARNRALEIEYKNNLITKNRWLELNGEDTIGPEGDVYYSEETTQQTEGQTEEQQNQ